MLRAVLFILFASVLCDSIAQTPDTIQVKAPAGLDSINALANKKLSHLKSRQDSLLSLASASRLKDSLKVEEWTSELQARITQKFSGVSATKHIDSLRSIGVPPNRIKRYTDSLGNKQTDLLREVDEKRKSLHSKVTTRSNAWITSVRRKVKLDSFKLTTPQGLPNANGGQPNLPAAGIPDLNLPDANVPSLGSADFSALEISSDLKAVGGDMAVPSTATLQALELKIPSVPDPMKEVSSGMTELKALKENPGATAEKAVEQISEVGAATQQLQDAQQLTQGNEAMQAADQLKNSEDAKQLIQREAVNHFAGKEEILQGAMDNMAKYKDKYESLSSIADVKKTWLPINGLKGVPFRERIRLGLSLGFRTQNDTLLLDFFPNVSYRISGRFEAGMGFMYRVRLNTREFVFNQRNPVWGWNTFVVVKTFKSIFLRLEMDGNSYPSGKADNPSYRDWRWSFLSGVQTNFKISTLVTGNVQMLYNFDSNLKDGFPERLSLRIGVQYKLNRKVVPKP